MARRSRRQYGFGTIYERSPGRWRIRWREGGEYHHGGPFSTRTEAERVLAKIISDIKAGDRQAHLRAADAPPLDQSAQDWLKRRIATHRSASDDRERWNNHLRCVFGKMKPDDVTVATLKRFIEVKIASGLSSSTVRLLMRLLSTFYSDLVEDGLATRNPVKMLPRATRRLIRPAHDPRTTPFIERLTDVRRIYLGLEEPVNVAYAIGALAGLRTGEILALRWEHLDLGRRRIHVQVQNTPSGILKDGDSRIGPIQDDLAGLLSEWKMKTGGIGLVIPPMRGGSRTRCNEGTIRRKLRLVLAKLGLPRVTWYQATRHTFASHWVLAGGSIETLKEILGHSTVLVTERYAHLRVDLFGSAELNRLKVDLRPAGGKVLALPTEAVVDGAEPQEENPRDDREIVPSGGRSGS